MSPIIWRSGRVCFHYLSIEMGVRALLMCYCVEDDLGALKHCRVHALADMLEIPALKAIAAAKLDIKLSTDWVTADFPGIVKEVYSMTNTRDHEVRNVLIRATRIHLNELLEVQEFKDVMFEFGEFSGGLVVDGQTSKCVTCAASVPQVYCYNHQTSKCVTCSASVPQIYCNSHHQTSKCTLCSSTSQLYCTTCALQTKKCPSCTCMVQIYCNSCRHNH
jgi:hypothetical protein